MASEVWRMEMPKSASELAHRENAGMTVVCVHPGGMPIRSYMQLAERMTGYSWHLVELSLNKRYTSALGKTDLPEGILGEIADEAIADLGEVWNTERLCLLGWSFGGVLACEMASRRKDGACGAVLLDSIAPRLFNGVMDGTQTERLIKLSRSQVVRVRWFTDYMRALKRVAWDVAGSDAHRLSEDDLIELMRLQLIANGGLPETTSFVGFSKVYREFSRGMNRNIAVILAHKPQSYGFPVHLVRSDYPLYEIFHLHEDMGWGQLAPNLTVSNLPLGHYEMLLEQQALDHISTHIENISHRLI
ncbi:alpha/beta fold hydrolase [Agrobacterium vitis]|uniref:Alpha/beta fold hydrolase n=2 Tax=Agrobacterium vitis TaxID=373 RepID=A0A7K1RA86_AGRVI|nr:alpha/beta fold hydrolase [Agrobacterium vitis]MVA55035.1 alpha/beta fold hydrolase [Agrobacterium vitis]